MRLCLNCGASFDGAGPACPHCGSAPGLRMGFPTYAPKLAEQNDDFNPQFFELMTEVEPTHFWFVSRNRILADVLRRYCPNPARILEIGCGTGFVLAGLRRLFPAARLSASDIYTEGLAFAAQRVPDAALFQMDARHIPYHEEFDLIGMFDVLEHIEEDEAVLRQVFAASKAGAGVILTVPQHRWLWSRMDDFAHHKRRYSRGELVEKLQRAGYEVEYATSFITLLLPLMLAARLLRQPAGSTMEDQMEAAGLRIGKLANALMQAAMAFERRMIGWGMRLPWGGSLLVFARKPMTARNR
jgi:SAM-dependent methyltransferase